MYLIWLPLAAVGLHAIMLVLLSRRRRKVVIKKIPSEPAFDLVELNTMLANGKITQEEFDRLREITMRQQEAAQQLLMRPESSKSHGFEVIIKENPPK
ncbi:MAG: hypothetical protein ABSG31_10955 [Tepidisphaeraceae bacterium]|jgi:predicted Zn-ribbon and HTH transcriptional regulator